MAGDNDLDVPTAAAVIPQSLWDLLEPCAVNTTATLPGSATPMSSTKILQTIEENPGQYDTLKQIGSIAAAGYAGMYVGLLTPAAPLVAVGLALTAAFSADERMITMIVLNGMEQELVREAATTFNHGMQTAHPQITRVDPVSGATITGAENTIPARITRTKIAVGQPPVTETVYGLGVYRFQKTQLNLFGKWPIPFALVGIEGGISFKTADGAHTGISVSFQVPETGMNAFAVTTDNKPHYGDLATFIAKTASVTKTIGNDRVGDIQIWASMIDRQYPTSKGSTDVVLTVAIMPL